MSDPLTAGEQAQMRAWRALNTVGWTVAAFVISGIVQTAGATLDQRIASEPALSALRAVHSLVQPFFAVIAGLAAGHLCASRLWSAQVPTAVAVTLAGAGIGLLRFATGEHALESLVPILSPVAAYVAARATLRARPR